MKHFRVLTLILTLVIAALGILFVVLGKGEPELPPLVSLISFQDADAPLVLPEGGRYDPRFHRLSGFERVSLPRAAVVNLPSAGAGDPGNGFHPAGDGSVAVLEFEGPGGPDSALGEAVHAVADSVVLYTGTPSEEWGNVVVAAHRSPDGRVVQSVYGHLGEARVRSGARIGRGQVLGTVGDADGRYPAHWHLQFRERDGAWPGSPVTGGASLPAFGMAETATGEPALHRGALALLRENPEGIQRTELEVGPDANPDAGDR